MSAVQRSRRFIHSFVLAIVALSGCTALSGCIVAGVSSGGGFFIWPGSIGLLVVVLIVYLISRR